MLIISNFISVLRTDSADSETVGLETTRKVLSTMLLKVLPIIYLVLLVVFIIFGSLHKDKKIQTLSSSAM